MSSLNSGIRKPSQHEAVELGEIKNYPPQLVLREKILCPFEMEGLKLLGNLDKYFTQSQVSHILKQTDPSEVLGDKQGSQSFAREG